MLYFICSHVDSVIQHLNIVAFNCLGACSTISAGSFRGQGWNSNIVFPPLTHILNDLMHAHVYMY